MGTRYADESRNEVLFVSGETTGSRVEREGLLDDGAFTLRVSDSIDGALKILEEHTIDCIVSDDTVSDGDGIAFLERVRVQYPTLPFILVTGTQDDERVSRAVSANVTEYLPRDSLTDMDRSLVSLTEQAIATHERRRELTDFELGATSVLEAARDPMFVLDAEEILYANENARDLFGIEAPARSPSVAPTSLFVGNSLPVSLSDIRETDSAFVSRPRVGIRVYGDETTVRLGASGIEWKGREAMVYILQDLSVTRTRISMVNRFFKAVQNSGHAIYITDSDGTIEYVNPAFEAITGYRAAEARGANPRILQSGEMSDGYYRDLYDCITSGEVWEEDITNRRKSGETYLAHQTIAPIRSADGTVEAYVGIQSEVTEQENARQTLVRYEQAINSSSDLLAAVDTDYDYLFANSRYRDLYGIADDVDITTLTLQEVLAAETFETVEPHIKKALSGETSETETDRVDPDGTVHTYSVRLFPLRDADEAIQGVGASLTDITERQHRREKLKRLSTYRETLHDASRVFLKEQPRTSTMSEVARTISRQDVFGCVTIVLLDDDSIEYTCSASEHVDLETVEEFHTDAYVDSVLDAGTLYMDDVTGAPYHHHPEQMRSHGGVALAIEHETEQYGILTVHLSPGVGYGSDIAHLLERLVEDLGSYLHLFELANRLETAYEIVERIEDPIMLQDSAGTFELVNQAVVEHAGLDREELLGTDEYAFMDEETAAQIQKYKDRVQSLAETLEYEVSPTFPEKGRKHFATDRYPHYDEDGDIDGTIAICRDVTDLRERERQLRVMDRLLRHNVNNSLNVVIGYAELIEERAQDDTIVESAERIVESGRSLLGTAQNERRISSVLAERPVPEAVDIGDVTRSVIDEGRQSYPDATVEFRAEGEVTAWVPPSVGSAIEELLENALRHSGDPTPHVSVVVSENGDAVSVTVTDTGPAIPPMDRKILTDEMEVHQLEHGTGVGLWLVKLVADLAEGAIEYAETDAGGNRITLILPKQH